MEVSHTSRKRFVSHFDTDALSLQTQQIEMDAFMKPVTPVAPVAVKTDVGNYFATRLATILTARSRSLLPSPLTPESVGELINNLSSSASSSIPQPNSVSPLPTSPTPTSSSSSSNSSSGSTPIPSDLGELLFTAENVQLINPRGRFNMSVFAVGVYFVNSKSDAFTITKSSVSSMVTFNKPDLYQKDQSKVKSKMCLITFSENNSSTPTFKAKPLKNVTLQAETKDSVTYSSALTGPAPTVWFSALSKSLSIPNSNSTPLTPNPSLYTSASGLPFVQCYSKVNEGFLFPMIEGLLFFKPAIFIPRGDLVSIAVGRGGGGGQATQYVDIG